MSLWMTGILAAIFTLGLISCVIFLISGLVLQTLQLGAVLIILLFIVLLIPGVRIIAPAFLDALKTIPPKPRVR